MELVVVYDLRSDPKRVATIQAASRRRGGFGLQREPALFGSRKWWRALGTDSLPVQTASGVISAVYWGSMNDWPEFRLRGANGETTWTREGEHTRYAEGLRAEVQYVVQKFKADNPMLAGGRPLEHNLVVKVLVEQSDLRRSAPTGGGIRRADKCLMESG